jgi:hypothetical protein
MDHTGALCPVSVCVKPPEEGSHSLTASSCCPTASRQWLAATLLMATVNTLEGRTKRQAELRLRGAGAAVAGWWSGQVGGAAGGCRGGKEEG